MSASEAAQGALQRARDRLGSDEPDLALLELELHAAALATDSDAWLIRAAALLALEREAEADRALADGLRVQPEHPRLLGLAAMARRRERDLAGAERLLLAGLSVAPEDTWLLSRYAEIVALAGQEAKAAALIARASAIDPHCSAVLSARYQVANLRGDDAETRRLARRMAARRPRDPEALALLGIERLHAHDLAGADRALRSVARLDARAEEENPALYDELRLRTHPLMLPLRVTDRIGPVVSWLIAALVLMGGAELSRRLGNPRKLDLAIGVVGLLWIMFCVYSWVAPPLLCRWFEHERSQR